MRRMKFFDCGIELIKKSTLEPTSKENPNKSREILHRFAGSSIDDELFFVQKKEVKSTNKKFLISIFPIEKWGDKQKKTFRQLGAYEPRPKAFF